MGLEEAILQEVREQGIEQNQCFSPQLIRPGYRS